MEIVKVSKKAINKAVKIIKKGGVVVFPTDTVYGFLADAQNKKAVAKIYKIKKRPRSKPLALFVKDIKMAKDLAEIDESQEKILKKYWFARPKSVGKRGPQKTTFILKRKNKGTVALRIPKHKFLNDLLKKIKKPLVQTSVNISGSSPLDKIKEIIEQFDGKVDLIIDAGNLPKRKPSKIIDLTDKKQKILRR